MPQFGSSSHRALIDHVAAHYRHDGRIRAIAVFGSVGGGTWHELSDVDLDIVTEDSARIAPAAEIAALFGTAAVIALARADSADVVLDSAAEISIRWHPLQTTSPNICATVRVVAGQLSDAAITAAGDANRIAPAAQRLLDSMVRDAIGAQKALLRGHRWAAVTAVEAMRKSLTELRGHRDGLRLDPADPAAALAAVLAEIRTGYDLGSRREALLTRLRTTPDTPPCDA